MTDQLSPELLVQLAGAALSLALSYVPGVERWYANLDWVQKAGSVALLMLAITAGVFALSCGALLAWVECSKTGAATLLSLYFNALTANQTVYLLTRKKNKSEGRDDLNSADYRHDPV